MNGDMFPVDDVILSLINATGGVNGKLPTEVTTYDLDIVRRTIHNERPYYYYCLIPKNFDNFFLELPGFIAINHYPPAVRLSDNELGTVANCRIVVTDRDLIAEDKTLGSEDIYEFIFYACLSSPPKEVCEAVLRLRVTK